MKMVSVVLVSMLLVFSSCGGKSKGGESSGDKAPNAPERGNQPTTGTDNGNGTGANPETNKPTTVAEIDCNKSWKEYLNHNRAGTLTEYEIKSEFNLSASSIPMKPTITKLKNEVVEANETQIVTKSTTTVQSGKDNVSTNTQKGSEFIAKCEEMKKSGVPASTLPNNSTILEQKEEFITVIAGTFNCKYQKVKMETPNSKNSTYELWIAKDLGTNLVIKSILKNEMSVSGQTMNSVTTNELVNFVNP